MNSRSLSVAKSHVSGFVYNAFAFITLYANLLLTLVIKCKCEWIRFGGTYTSYEWQESNLKA